MRLALDVALGVGGVPRGRVVEIYGPESSGKTTLGYHIIAEAQREGGVAAFIDAEHALNPEYARNVGVDIDNLLISQPDSGEQALEIAEMLVRSGAIDVVVVDSVAALVPRAELEGEMGDAHVGLQARLMSQALRKLVGAINKSRTTVIFINQLREKVGVMFGCFHYGARVVLADGRTEKIGKIVNQRLPVEVLSYDPATGRVQPRRVVNWFNNGRADQFLQFVVEGGVSGRRTFGVTPEPFDPDAARGSAGGRTARGRRGAVGRQRLPADRGPAAADLGGRAGRRRAAKGRRAYGHVSRGARRRAGGVRAVEALDARALLPHFWPHGARARV